MPTDSGDGGLKWMPGLHEWAFYSDVPGGFVGVTQDEDYPETWKWLLYLDAVPGRASAMGTGLSAEEAKEDAEENWKSRM